MTHDPIPTQQGYDLWSAQYDDDGNPLIALEATVFADLIGDINNKNLADIGCGTGRHSIPLAAAGARVTAIDFSQGMLDQARAKPGADAVRFIQHDLYTRLPLPDHAFDIVLCALVLDHIAKLDHLFAEFTRLAAPTGHIAITVMHPAMLLAGVQARFNPSESDPDHRVVVESVPNQIADYVTAACRANLTIDHIAEYPMTQAVAATHPRGGPYIDWPVLLTMRLKP